MLMNETYRLAHDFLSKKRYEHTLKEERQERFSVQVNSVYSWCLAALMCLGCGAPSSSKDRLSIFAASSLTEVFTELKAQFEQSYPQYDVRLNFAGSQVLRLQIENGASADVFASADLHHIHALKKHTSLQDERPFAVNRLSIIVPKNGTLPSKTINDLAQARRIILGTPHSPIGKYSELLLDRIGTHFGAHINSAIQSHIVSREKNVRLVRAKVIVGAADAAVVYESDARHVDALDTIHIPDALNPRVEYVAARLNTNAGSTLWLEFLASAAAQATLGRAGFEGVR